MSCKYTSWWTVLFLGMPGPARVSGTLTLCTAATDYATAAQGTKADTALQSNSTLNADNMTTGTLNGGTY